MFDPVPAAMRIPGQTNADELHWLRDRLRTSKAHAEIGVYCGRSLFVSACAMNGGVLYAVDPLDSIPEVPSPGWVPQVVQATIRAAGEHSKTEIRLLNATSLAAANSLPDDLQLDSVFIDAKHTYAEVAADIECWRAFLRPGGLLCGHDFWPANRGVMRAVKELVPGYELCDRIWFG
jgi:predicted O-methyltransferase YrrM